MRGVTRRHLEMHGFGRPACFHSFRRPVARRMRAAGNEPWFLRRIAHFELLDQPQSMDRAVNVHDAKTHFYRLLERVESGEEIILARNGHPVARLVPYRPRTAPGRLGLYRGQIEVAEDFDAADAEVLRLFEEGD